MLDCMYITRYDEANSDSYRYLNWPDSTVQEAAMEQVLMNREGKLFGQTGETVLDPMTALSSALALDGSCSLRSFFFLLKNYPDLQRISGFLPKALDDVADCPASGCLHDEIEALVVGKTMELIGFPGEPRAELYLWLRGLARPETPEEADAPGASLRTLPALMEAHRDIRFIPLQLLLDTPLLLGGMKHVVLGGVNRDLHCATRFTLFEVVDGLAWELGFQGGSQQCSLGR